MAKRWNIRRLHDLWSQIDVQRRPLGFGWRNSVEILKCEFGPDRSQMRWFRKNRDHQKSADCGQSQRYEQAQFAALLHTDVYSTTKILPVWTFFRNYR